MVRFKEAIGIRADEVDRSFNSKMVRFKAKAKGWWDEERPMFQFQNGTI